MISVEVKGLEQLLPKIASLPDALKEEVITTAGEYALEVVKEYPPQNYITRAEAYPDAPAGPGWFSDRQRRWFFAALASGEISIPYQRTNTLKDSWVLSIASSHALLYNGAPYAPYVLGYAFQSRHEKKVGWRVTAEIIQEQLTFQNSKYRAMVHEAIRQALHKVQIE